MKSYKNMFNGKESKTQLEREIDELKRKVEARSVELYGPGGEKQLSVVQRWDDLPDSMTAELLSNGYVQVFNGDGTEWGCIPLEAYAKLRLDAGLGPIEKSLPEVVESV